MSTEFDDFATEDHEDYLDIKELSDSEFDLPFTSLPSLESILWDIDSEGSDNASLHSLQSLTLALQSMLQHKILQGISSQITSAGERVRAGLPTVITNSLKFIAIGTSHGYVLAFDTEQKLCWCSHDSISNDQGAISAMAFNMDSTRLLVGYERGFILMLDALNGDVLRRLPDAHAPGSAVLQLRFTASNNLALVGDSSGSVFSISFYRKLGLRSWDSKCLFSGARGEVCCFEPLVQCQELLGQNVILAIATLTKIIIITIEPNMLKVLYRQLLPRAPISLPLLSWQLVLVGKTWQPVLAWGRGTNLNYTRVIFAGISRNKIRLATLRCVQLPFTMTALHWIGSRHLAVLDTSENLRLIEVRTQKELEMLEIANAGLVYSSAHFKALAVGGGVSEAFALAGERACYNSLSSRGDQLLVLGTRAVHLVKLRTWHERLLHLSEQARWTEALNLAAEEGPAAKQREKSADILIGKYIGSLNKTQANTDKDSITAAVNCCIKLDKIDILCNDLWDRISTDSYDKELFFNLLSQHITSGSLVYLSPSITQLLVDYLSQKDIKLLQDILLSLDLHCLDLHQVLKICKKHRLYDAWIHITTKTIGDYTSPLTEFINELGPDNHSLGNTLLVYVSACLAGLGYPKGEIEAKDKSRVKYDVLRCLEAPHSANANDQEHVYPYLRALLLYNTRECLNVVKLAFTEVEFSGEMGLLQRQRLIEILLQIVKPPDFQDHHITVLACFVAKLISSNNLKVDDSILNSIIASLTQAGHDLSLRDHSEREQALLDLYFADKLTFMDDQSLLKIALESKCFRVAEHIYEHQKDYAKILACYLNDPLRKSEVFTYIDSNIRNAKRLVEEQFFEHFVQISEINVRKCVDIVIEHYFSHLPTLYTLLASNEQLTCSFLKELVNADVKIPEDLAENYLEILCKSRADIKTVLNYLQMGHCRVENALRITKHHKVYVAESLLLEQTGEYAEALQLLLQHNLTAYAVDVCVRGSDHLDAKESQQLWLTLLKHPRSSADDQRSDDRRSDDQREVDVSLREMLHLAAPHVPLPQLMDLVSNANFGDVKVLLEGMLTDCANDLQIFEATKKLQGRDLHQRLAKSLKEANRGLGVQRLSCDMCQLSFLCSLRSNNNDKKQGGEAEEEKGEIVIWGCAHSFHRHCISNVENICPVCRTEGVFIDASNAKGKGGGRPKIRRNCNNNNKNNSDVRRLRPNVEGHF